MELTLQEQRDLEAVFSATTLVTELSEHFLFLSAEKRESGRNIYRNPRTKEEWNLTETIYNKMDQFQELSRSILIAMNQDYDVLKEGRQYCSRIRDGDYL